MGAEQAKPIDAIPVKPECVICMDTIDDPAAAAASHSKKSSKAAAAAGAAAQGNNNNESSNTNFIRCRFSHYMCRGCISRYVAETWLARPAEAGVVPEVACSHPGCGVVFREHQIALAVPEDVFGKYMEKRLEARDGVVLARMRDDISRMPPEELRDLARADQQILAQQLRKQLGNNLLKCSKCGFGPIEHAGCSDLAAHHMQRSSRGGDGAGAGGGGGAVISNACPNCGYHARSKNEWLPWDGVIQAPADLQDHKRATDVQNRGALASAALFVLAVLAWKHTSTTMVALLGGGVVMTLVKKLDPKRFLPKTQKKNSGAAPAARAS